MQKGRFAIVGIGYALFLAMTTFLLLGFPFLPQFDFAESFLSWSAFFEPSYVIAFFLCVLVSVGFPRVRDSVPFAAAALLSMGGALLLCFSSSLESLPLLYVSGVLFGLGDALCFVCWEFAFAMSGYEEAKKQIVFGSALSAIPFLLLYTSEESLLLPLVLLFAVCSFVLLFFALRTQQGDVRGAVDLTETSCSLSALLGSFKKPLLCIFLIGFLWPIVEMAIQGDTQALDQTFVLNLLANLLAAMVMGLIWLVLGKEVGVESAYLVLFPLLITVFLLLPWISEDFYPLALLFLLFAFSLFSIVNMMACIKISFEKSASLVSAFSFSAGVLYGSRLLGQVVAGLLKRSSLSQETLVVGCSFFLLYICSIAMFVLSSKKKPAEGDAKGGVEGSAAETGAAAGVEAADAVILATICAPESESASAASAFSVVPDEAPAPAGVDVLHEECLLLAQERGLTPRQTEVLDLLVHGNDVPSIAKKLYISENTVRTHTKKIYLLLDVHSKQEIVDLVDARCVSHSGSPSGGVQQAGVSSDSPSQGETVD